MPALPPCGIGGQASGGGPCSGTYSPGQAGQDAFVGVHASPVINALLAAGVLLAALVFVVVMVRKVGKFFGRADRYVDPAGPGTVAHADAFWAEVGKSYKGTIPDADFTFDDDTREPDAELDHELDADPSAESADDQLLLGSPERDAEKQGADMTDEEFDAMEWREEWKRENGLSS